jgi:predicted esterase
MVDDAATGDRPGVTRIARRLWPIALTLVARPPQSCAQNPPPPATEIPLRQGLVIGAPGRQGRTPVRVDPLEAQLVAGQWRAPKEGDTLTLTDGEERRWETITADPEGWLQHRALRGGYFYAAVASDTRRVMLLEASGHAMVTVNGEPRMGDPYQMGAVRLPVLLRPGANDFLFQGGRGRVKAQLVTPRSPAVLSDQDTTLPDLIVGEPVRTLGAVVVANATTASLNGLSLSAACGTGSPVVTPLPALPPLSVRKVAFRLEGPTPTATGSQAARLRLVRNSDSQSRTLDTLSLPLRVRLPEQSRKRTFRSGIDGSVQYYAEAPAQPVRPGGPPPALFLTLHGAGVEAIGQVDAYAGKSWGHLVAPTNRRPYGFDWEDWGRLDALEVLDLARQRLRPDPWRIYLTGHSMGGHGAWHLGVTFPDRFAAVAPSAGWISFWSYAGGVREPNPTPVQAMLQRAASPSDTLALARNLADLGVYILHGDADDNVPVGQARQMREHLAGFHHDLTVHEQHDAGHWWDVSPEPGADCVDWLPLFDFFAHHVRPEPDAVREVEFRTASPGVSAWRHWAGILAQTRPLQVSTVRLRWDPGLRRFSGTTDNVFRLALRLDHVQPGVPLSVELDGQKLEGIAWPTSARQLWLSREGERWKPVREPSLALKGPHRYGPFKEAFRNRMQFVYATRGTREENAWAFAKARFDAEQFWYRGNGSVDVVADTAFNPAAERDRSVILYGNADTHAAWKALLGHSPVQVRRGLVRVGDRDERGDDLACLFLRPRPGSDRALVGAVAGSGLAGMRLTDRLPYFVAGVAYPDCTVLGPEVLREGSRVVRGAGFFGADWGIPSGDFAWQER